MKIPTNEEIKLSEMRTKITEIIENNPGCSQNEIAKILETSRQVISYHIIALKKYGFVKIENENGKSRCFIK